MKGFDDIYRFSDDVVVVVVGFFGDVVWFVWGWSWCWVFRFRFGILFLS